MTGKRKDPEHKTRSGFVAILGAPNAGKSTLLNKFVGQKISITSPKPQTTRMKITGICTEGDDQIVFMDTPGVFAPKRRLDRAMVQAAWLAIDDADAVLLLVDASEKPNDKTDAIVKELRRRKKRVTLALNKIDKLARAKLLPVAAHWQDADIADDIFMISAKSTDGIEDLRQHLAQKMPQGPWFFGEDELSDMPSQLLAAEITREQLYRQLQQELPYAATVAPESWEPRADGSVTIRQRIIVARKAHKPIVLGAKGARIKAIGEAARRDIAKFLGQPVHLFLEVACDEKWQDRATYYHMFGLDFKTSEK